MTYKTCIAANFDITATCFSACDNLITTNINVLEDDIKEMHSCHNTSDFQLDYEYLAMAMRYSMQHLQCFQLLQKVALSECIQSFRIL